MTLPTIEKIPLQKDYDKVVWICGQYKGSEKWEFQGVFDEKDLAEKACINRTYFIGPAKINEKLPDEQQSWPGCYYPFEKLESLIRILTKSSDE